MLMPLNCKHTCPCCHKVWEHEISEQQQARRAEHNLKPCLFELHGIRHTMCAECFAKHTVAEEAVAAIAKAKHKLWMAGGRTRDEFSTPSQSIRTVQGGRG